MNRTLLEIDAIVETIYESAGSDPDFSVILAEFRNLGDTDMADVIETDGRRRIQHKMTVTLDRYLLAISDLNHLPVSLDAAIDMTIRSLESRGMPRQSLIDKHPEYRKKIEESMMLSDLLWSTITYGEHLNNREVEVLPKRIGNAIDDGEGRYELRMLLGEGAAGHVYLAVDRLMSTDEHNVAVAVKILSDVLESSADINQAEDEATKARRIRHLNVVSVLDRGITDNKQRYIVYEFIEGGTLNQWLRRVDPPPNIEQLVSLASQVARGVHAAHAAGVIHYDIKPNNVLMTEDLVPKVSDFGTEIIKRDAKNTADEKQSDEYISGNLPLIAPEQYRGDRSLFSISVDIYALSGLTFWLLTGKAPNGDSPVSVSKTMRMIQQGSSHPRLHLLDGMDRDLRAIIERSLDPDPEKRHESAAAFASDLETWVNKKPITWTKPSIFRIMRLWIKRKPLVASLLTILIITLVGGGIYLTQLSLDQAAKERFRKELNESYEAILFEFNTSSQIGIELLPQMWVMEWFYGPTVLGDGVDTLRMWFSRVDTIRNLVEIAKDNHRGNDLEILLWESCLAFWLVRTGEYDEALCCIEDCQDIAKYHLGPTDTLNRDLAALKNCIYVQLEWQSQNPDLDYLESLKQKLVEAEESMMRTHPAAPIQRIVVVHILTIVENEQMYNPLLSDFYRARLAYIDE